ncbi:ABC transporter permease [Microlunatus ginsengisoli]|uniref:HIG1 domain-containing protein n=1 Tax=Microlunatus ginsengisoli TaxID=363863 RepID=A0ABP7AKJ2_9ACTN
MPTQPGPSLLIALALLLLMAIAAFMIGGFRTQHPIATAAGRAVLQLAVVSLVIAAAFNRSPGHWSSPR